MTVQQSVCTNTPLGREDGSIIRINDSFDSNTLSVYIEILTDRLISPTGIAIFSGPLS